MYKRKAKGFWKHLDFLIIDIFCMLAALFLAMLFRFHGSSNGWEIELYFRVFTLAIVSEIVVTIALNPFKNVLKRGYYKEFVKTIQHVAFVELVLVFILYIAQLAEPVSRLVMGLFPVLYVIFAYIARILWKKFLKLHAWTDRNILVITNSDMACDVLENMKTGEYETIHTSGFIFLDQPMEGQTVCDIPVVATQDNMMEYICHGWVDEVLVVLPEDAKRPSKLLQQLSEAGVTRHYVIATNSSRLEHNEIVDQIGKYTVMTDAINSVTWVQALLKRLMDIAGGLFGCLITGCLYLYLAPKIRRQSPGPVFFSQERIGQNGRPFKMYKFRSMYMDAEERKKELEELNRAHDGMMFKLDFDPRIIGNEILPDGTHKTGLGDFMRRTSLDEFPQFFNVLKGDMSLVGTRPPTLDEWEKYDIHHRARMATKPGITGLWQVSGRSKITDFEEVVRLDTDYIRSWSLGLDIKILLKTIRCVVKKDGAM
ncbi:MAG: sugar transferase [Lachnospiraceae bacterium]|nr:sugar transferase [Lachnospiraceae bacterium]